MKASWDCCNILLSEPGIRVTILPTCHSTGISSPHKFFASLLTCCAFRSNHLRWLIKYLPRNSSTVLAVLTKGSRIFGDNCGGENLTVWAKRSRTFKFSSLNLYTILGTAKPFSPTDPAFAIANANEGKPAWAIAGTTLLLAIPALAPVPIAPTGV